MRTLTAFVAVIAALVLSGCDRSSEEKAAQKAAKKVESTVESAKIESHAKPADIKDSLPDCCTIDVITTQPTTKPTAENVAAPKPATVESAVAVAKPTTSPATKPSTSRASPWTEPDKRTSFGLDYDMTDHNGNAVKLTQYLGKPTVYSFFFTRCGNPQMCPLIAYTMGKLQKELAKTGIADKTNCVLISYDPLWDNPERMTAFGKERGFDLKQGSLLSPKPDQFRDFVIDWELAFGMTTDAQINHKMEMMMFDKHGKFVREYHGEIWKNEEVIADLQRLLAEP